MAELDPPVQIAEYDPAWPERFERERRRLAGMLPGAEIEHFGSTAVPGLAAKPTIDVIALVDDLDRPIAVLVERGRYSFPVASGGSAPYSRPSAAPCPQSPCGRHNPELDDPRRRLLSRPGWHLTLTDDRGEFERRLHFRDALRADGELAREYEELKRSLAERFADDREAYTAAKTAFVARASAGG